jgi:hypothetical protein
MQNNNDGETPNNDTPQPEDPASEANNGSESADIKPTADENQQPKKENNGSESGDIKPTADENNHKGNRKKRRPDAEILANLQKQIEKIAAKQRLVKNRHEKLRDKELIKLKLVIGGACLNQTKNVGTAENTKKLNDLINKHVLVCDKSWHSQHFNRLFKEHTTPKSDEGDANGVSPSPS